MNNAPQTIKDEMAAAINQFGKKSREVSDLWWAIRNCDRRDYSGVNIQYSITHRKTLASQATSAQIVLRALATVHTFVRP